MEVAFQLYSFHCAIHNSAGDWIRKARITSSSSPGPPFVTSNSLLRRMASVKMTIICVAFLAFYFALFSHVQAIECYDDSDCGYSKYCCIRGNYDNVCRHNCIGESCEYNSNCATGESCCYATKKCALNCVGKSCSYDSECGTGESCCDSTRKCAKICFGESCSFDSDCATGESCCTGSYKCAGSCVGESCYYDGDCSTGESCCEGSLTCNTNCIGESCSNDRSCAAEECCGKLDGECKSKDSKDCDLVLEFEGSTSWIAAVVVLGIIVVVGVPVAVVVFYCRFVAGARPASARRLVDDDVTEPITTGTAVPLTQHQPHSAQQVVAYVQNPQTYLNQPPPYQP